MTKDLLIAALAVILFFLLLNREKFTNKETMVITKYDTVITKKEVVKYKKGQQIPYKVIDTILQTNIVHDTIKIISDYSRVYAYSDTIKLDSNGYVFIKDTISQNKIQGREVKAEITEKTIYIETIKTTPPKFAVYWGLRGDYRLDNKKLEGSIGVAFKGRKKGLFTINYGMQGYSVGMYQKLF